MPRSGPTLIEVESCAQAYQDGNEALELRLYDQAEARYRDAVLYDGGEGRYHAALGATRSRGKRGSGGGPERGGAAGRGQRGVPEAPRGGSPARTLDRSIT